MDAVTERKERRKVLVRSWEQAETTFARLARTPKHGGPARAIIGYATWLHQRWPGQVGEGQPNYAVKFHATDVVTFYPDGRIRLATGGWLTKTTADRIEDYTPEGITVRTRGIPRRGRAPVGFWVIDGSENEHDMTSTGYVTIAPNAGL